MSATHKHEPAGWPAYPGEWERDGRSGFNQGIDRDTYIFTAILAGLMANASVLKAEPGKVVQFARKMTDEAHGDSSRAFRERVQRASAVDGAEGSPF